MNESVVFCKLSQVGEMWGDEESSSSAQGITRVECAL